MDFSGRRPWATAARRDPRSENVAVGINNGSFSPAARVPCGPGCVHSRGRDGGAAREPPGRCGAWRRATHAACV